jgi:hypothetical protein
MKVKLKHFGDEIIQCSLNNKCSKSKQIDLDKSINTELMKLGGCSGTEFGCCPDSKISKVDKVGTNCSNNTIQTPTPIPIIGGCRGTRYGCCLDGTTPANSNSSNCPFVPIPTITPILVPTSSPNPIIIPTPIPTPIPIIGGCRGTRYGCCPDSTTPANSKFSNCPSIPIIGGCSGTEFGCCPDGITSAKGIGYMGCPSMPTPIPIPIPIPIPTPTQMPTPMPTPTPIPTPVPTPIPTPLSKNIYFDDITNNLRIRCSRNADYYEKTNILSFNNCKTTTLS